MRYMLLIGSDDKNAPPRPRAEMEALVQGHRRFSDELQAAGKMVAGERLRSEGARSSRRTTRSPTSSGGSGACTKPPTSTAAPSPSPTTSAKRPSWPQGSRMR